MTNSPAGFLTGRRLARFEAIQATIVPRAARFTPEERARSRAIVEQVLARQDPAVRRKLGLFLLVIHLLAWLRWGRPFARLDAERRLQHLAWFQDHRIRLFRQGLWGVATIAKMGVYGQPELYPELGYHPKELSDDDAA